MKFGIFDHMDRGTQPLGQQYEDRLRLAEAYDGAGIYAYHLAEHHSTPLGMAPSPSVFLSAVAQRTKRLRFGPLVYPLAFYHPIRVMEEVCMLDHLSGGRLELGIGRGVSPIEVGYYGVDPAEGQARYMEAYAVLMQGLTHKTLSHQGRFFTFRDVPIEIAPLQKPHPPLWYGTSNAEGAAWAAKNAINGVANGPVAYVRGITDRYRAGWAAAGRDPAHLPLIGMSRHIVVAESDREATEIARRGYAHWHASFMHLWRKHNATPVNLAALYPEDFEESQRLGFGVAGTPATVRDYLAPQIEDAGINYLVCRFAFGDLALAETLQSLDLFAREVMPALTEMRAAAE